MPRPARSVLRAEIGEQPHAVARVLAREARRTAALAARLAKADLSWVLVAARGTSDNAARYAQYAFGIVHRLPVALATRLKSLLDRQDAGQPLTPDERAEAEGLVDVADLLTLLRLRAERGAA